MMTSRQTGTTSDRGGPRLSGRGFTLIELTIVVVIIVLLVSLTAPAIRRLWDDRKVADAQNSIQGMLQVAVSRAATAESGERGLFFMVDEDGRQHVYPIAQYMSGDPVLTENLFFITDEQQTTLPAPMRVVPRYAVEPDSSDAALKPVTFSDAELGNDGFLTPDPGVTPDVGQRHRNFFTVVFTLSGVPKVRRDVLIADVNEDSQALDDPPHGDRTGLPVAMTVGKYYAQSGGKVDIDPRGTGVSLAGLVHPSTGKPLGVIIFDKQDTTAVNLPSVDGLLVYDDSGFRELELASAQRDYLLQTARPFYINRNTGSVVLGPIGENEIPQ